MAQFLNKIYNQYKKVLNESMVGRIKKTIGSDIEDVADTQLQIPENYIEIALMRYLDKKGVRYSLDVDGFIEKNPIDGSRWSVSEIDFEGDDENEDDNHLVVKWLKIGGDEDDYVWETFYGYDDDKQLKIINLVRDWYGDEPVTNLKLFYFENVSESMVGKIKNSSSVDLDSTANEMLCPKDYIELAIMALMQKRHINFTSNILRNYKYEDEYGDVWVLREVVMQDDGLEIGTYSRNHYIEICWEYREGGQDEGDEEYYPLKDEDEEVQLGIYQCLLYNFNLGEEFRNPKTVWQDFSDSLDESMVGKIKNSSSVDLDSDVDKMIEIPENYIELATVVLMQKKHVEIICPEDFELNVYDEDIKISEICILTADDNWDVEYKYGIEIKTLVQDEDEEYGWRSEIYYMEDLKEETQLEVFKKVSEELRVGDLNPKLLWREYSEINESMVGKIKNSSVNDIDDEVDRILEPSVENLIQILSKYSKGNMMGNHCVDIEMDVNVPKVKIKVRKNYRRDNQEYAHGRLKDISWWNVGDKINIRLGWKFEEPYTDWAHSAKSSVVDYYEVLSEELKMKIYNYVQDADNEGGQRIKTRY